MWILINLVLSYKFQKDPIARWINLFVFFLSPHPDWKLFIFRPIITDHIWVHYNFLPHWNDQPLTWFNILILCILFFSITGTVYPRYTLFLTDFFLRGLLGPEDVWVKKTRTDLEAVSLGGTAQISHLTSPTEGPEICKQDQTKCSKASITNVVLLDHIWSCSHNPYLTLIPNMGTRWLLWSCRNFS